MLNGRNHGNIDKILQLKPDLVLGFSDLQADIAAQLIKHGLNVFVFNQRSVAEIVGVIQTLGSLVGAAENLNLIKSCSAQTGTRSMQ
ncbi:MAG TPA: ABC transporter substrate-binding protein [Pseudomonadales bacterium]|nr:ABC transporter substrate-binding protein [Pseudomonadales bacterium]